MEKPSLDTAKAGAIRFNTDGSQMEIYDGNQWTGILADLTPFLQTGGTRAIFYSGNVASDNRIQFVNIDSTGNAIDFGDANQAARVAASFSSRTRCFKANGYADGSGGRNDIEFVTFTSQGNGTDFGDSTAARWNACGFSNTTRGIAAGGEYPGTNFFDIIDYVTMSSSGNAVDFGDLLAGNQVGQNGAMSSPTRAVIAGGFENGNPAVQRMQYVTMSTLGNAAEFGDLTTGQQRTGCCSNAVRGVMGAGTPAGNLISFVTMATLGDAQDFGDSLTAEYGKAGMNSPTRGIWAGPDNNAQDQIEYVQLMTTGNAQDFGDLLENRRQVSGSSNGHGGL